mmetsp:Transcript_23293/g.47663  ORF Transcript_23293/g.47663 Transcript_23293/m.47663 type:complete len:326 (+) Transcript_23293:335-1312(+)
MAQVVSRAPPATDPRTFTSHLVLSSCTAFSEPSSTAWRKGGTPAHGALGSAPAASSTARHLSLEVSTAANKGVASMSRPSILNSIVPRKFTFAPCSTSMLAMFSAFSCCSVSPPAYDSACSRAVRPLHTRSTCTTSKEFAAAAAEAGTVEEEPRARFRNSETMAGCPRVTARNSGECLSPSRRASSSSTAASPPTASVGKSSIRSVARFSKSPRVSRSGGKSQSWCRSVPVTPWPHPGYGLWAASTKRCTFTVAPSMVRRFTKASLRDADPSGSRFFFTQSHCLNTLSASLVGFTSRGGAGGAGGSLAAPPEEASTGVAAAAASL